MACVNTLYSQHIAHFWITLYLLKDSFFYQYHFRVLTLIQHCTRMQRLCLLSVLTIRNLP